jgi:hypothetical protein
VLECDLDLGSHVTLLSALLSTVPLPKLRRWTQWALRIAEEPVVEAWARAGRVEAEGAVPEADLAALRAEAAAAAGVGALAATPLAAAVAQRLGGGGGGGGGAGGAGGAFGDADAEEDGEAEAGGPTADGGATTVPARALPLGHAGPGRMLSVVTEAEALAAHLRRKLQLQAVVNEVLGEVAVGLGDAGASIAGQRSWPSSKWCVGVGGGGEVPRGALEWARGRGGGGLRVVHAFEGRREVPSGAFGGREGEGIGGISDTWVV